jgi:hypothetical protein
MKTFRWVALPCKMRSAPIEQHTCTLQNFEQGSLALQRATVRGGTPHHTTPHHTTPYHTIPYHTIPYHTIPHRHPSWGHTTCLCEIVLTPRIPCLLSSTQEKNYVRVFSELPVLLAKGGTSDSTRATLKIYEQVRARVSGIAEAVSSRLPMSPIGIALVLHSISLHSLRCCLHI